MEISLYLNKRYTYADYFFDGLEINLNELFEE